MDVKTVRGRCEHEGISFLTISLPNFGKDFEKSLDQGLVDRRLFAGFQRKGELPRFLGGFLDLVFDRDSGVLLDQPSIDAIRAVRQLSLMYGKLALPCSDARVRNAFDGYIECEQEVRLADASRARKFSFAFEMMSARLFQDVFTDVDREIYHGRVVPKHGPGATADKLVGNNKFNLRTWTERLEEIFPAGENIIPSPSYYDELDSVHFLEPGSELPVRVISVPKTLKTPRIIGIEPTAMQYSQQALKAEITIGVQKSNLLNALIGFDDQIPNQALAHEGSLTGSLATLDLSEASDRVSNQLVRTMLRRWPHLHKAVDASRSRKADVPGHGVVRLAKFASMGSALTFPIEAMVFLTIICLGIEESLRTPLSHQDLLDLRGKVRVYGDDIIVPVEHVRSVITMLETFGFRVNDRKSFWNGKFRESCGREYYAGEDVSIVRVRTMPPTSPKDATRVISWVSTRNQFYFAGYWQTCSWLDEAITNVIHHYPVVAPTSRVQGRHSFLGYETQGYDKFLHRPLVKGYVETSVLPSISLDGTGALLKFHLKSAMNERLHSSGGHGAQPGIDGGHLERSGRPQSVDIKLRNACPF